MLTLATERPTKRSGFAERRAIAVANANYFRALAWRALRDGAPNGPARAANARAAARIVLRQAKRDALVYRMATDALTGVA
jgi:hypothetical protein